MTYPILNFYFLEIVLKEVPSESFGGHNLPLKNPTVIKENRWCPLSGMLSKLFKVCDLGQ